MNGNQIISFLSFQYLVQLVLLIAINFLAKITAKLYQSQKLLYLVFKCHGEVSVTLLDCKTSVHVLITAQTRIPI